MNLKEIYNKYENLLEPILYLKNRLFSIKIRNNGKNNIVNGLDCCRVKNSKITINGENNIIEFNKLSSIYDVNISIIGSNNRIMFGETNYLEKCNFCIEDDNNLIETKNHVYILNNTEISAIESTKILIGEDCLFSANIMLRTGDSHSLIDIKTNKRINKSLDISIGNKVWICNGAKILKGSIIENNSVVGTGAIVTQKTKSKPNTVLAGSPAKIIKKSIDWERERI